MSYLPAYCLLIPVLALAACTKPWTPTHEYTCPDGYAFTIAYSNTDNPGDIAILEDADGKTKLPRAPSASGTRYSNGATIFLSADDKAQIQQAGTIVHRECTTH
jgi:membrane-bound inhibitor of C-type lysozyme